MEQPATQHDPLWLQRQWQSYYEPRADYIKRLYEMIRDSKLHIAVLERIGATRPTITELVVPNINLEREALHTALKELKNVLRR